MKKTGIFLFSMLFSMLAFGAVDHFIYTDKSHDGPLEIVNHNLSSDNEAMTEVRVLNNVNCGHDLGVVSSNYNADTTISPNEAFLVAESTCNGMLLKSNGNNYIRFAVGLNPTNKFKVMMDGAEVTNAGDTLFEVRNTSSGAAGEVLADNGNNVYIGSKSNSPFHLMANRQARVTVFPSANVELWKSSNCPAAGAPQNGGYLCVDQSGALWYRGPSTATKLANP